jgi:hypothetical protein
MSGSSSKGGGGGAKNGPGPHEAVPAASDASSWIYDPSCSTIRVKVTPNGILASYGNDCCAQWSVRQMGKLWDEITIHGRDRFQQFLWKVFLPALGVFDDSLFVGRLKVPEWEISVSRSQAEDMKDFFQEVPHDLAWRMFCHFGQFLETIALMDQVYAELRACPPLGEHSRDGGSILGKRRFDGGRLKYRKENVLEFGSVPARVVPPTEQKYSIIYFLSNKSQDDAKRQKVLDDSFIDDEDYSYTFQLPEAQTF